MRFWFSRYGTLVSTLEALVNQSPPGCFADELADTLHAEVQDPLHDLVRAGRLRRSAVTRRFLYTSVESRQARDQLRTRKTAQSVPLVADASALQISPEELKAASWPDNSCELQLDSVVIRGILSAV
jgi:hypothetical protein